MRVGLLGHGFVEWAGGVDFARGLASSLLEADSTIELHAIVPSRRPGPGAEQMLRRAYRSARRWVGRASAPATPLDPRRVAEFATPDGHALALHPVDDGAPALAALGRRLALDVLLPSISALPSSVGMPWVGYLYDFQHRHLPHLFAPADRQMRDKAFSAVLEQARAVVVNSRAVADDARRFHPQARAKLFALPFNAAPQPGWLDCDDEVVQRLGLSDPYFIVCNQFWQHKDHRTAFEAFARLVASHSRLTLICTGPTIDHRAPGYFEALQCSLTELGIAERVNILGLVPKREQIALLKGALALVQPTMFEGGPGGGAVYDALALGVRCLVSDIAVNRELDDRNVAFFPLGDAAALATLMDSIARGPAHEAPDRVSLQQRGRARRAACGVQLLAAIEHARSADR